MTTDKIHPPCTALVDWRVANGLTQQQAAQFIGVSKNQIAKWENGRALPRYRTLQVLVQKTGLEASDLVNVTVNPKPAGLRSDDGKRGRQCLDNDAKSDKQCSAKSPNRIQGVVDRTFKPAPGRSISAADRLALNTKKTESCWYYVGTRVGYGYGQIVFGRKRIGAHRLAYELAHGAIPKGMVVCHRCDVPNCVNPDHLFLATQAENIRDAHRKGRYTAWQRTGKRLNGQPSKL